MPSELPLQSPVLPVTEMLSLYPCENELLLAVVVPSEVLFC